MIYLRKEKKGKLLKCRGLLFLSGDVQVRVQAKEVTQPHWGLLACPLTGTLRDRAFRPGIFILAGILSAFQKKKKRKVDCVTGPVK